VGEVTRYFLSVSERTADYVNYQPHGPYFDPDLVRATAMNLIVAAGSRGSPFHMTLVASKGWHLQY